MKINFGLLGLVAAQSGDERWELEEYDYDAQDRWGENQWGFSDLNAGVTFVSQDDSERFATAQAHNFIRARHLSCWNSNTIRDMNNDNKFSTWFHDTGSTTEALIEADGVIAGDRAAYTKAAAPFTYEALYMANKGASDTSGYTYNQREQTGAPLNNKGWLYARGQGHTMDAITGDNYTPHSQYGSEWNYGTSVHEFDASDPSTLAKQIGFNYGINGFDNTENADESVNRDRAAWSNYAVTDTATTYSTGNKWGYQNPNVERHASEGYADGVVAYNFGHRDNRDYTANRPNFRSTNLQNADSLYVDDWRYQLRMGGCLYEATSWFYDDESFNKVGRLTYSDYENYTPESVASADASQQNTFRSGSFFSDVHWVHVFNAHIFPDRAVGYIGGTNAGSSIPALGTTDGYLENDDSPIGTAGLRRSERRIEDFNVVMANPTYEGHGFLNFVATYHDHVNYLSTVQRFHYVGYRFRSSIVGLTYRASAGELDAMYSLRHRSASEGAFYTDSMTRKYGAAIYENFGHWYLRPPQGYQNDGTDADYLTTRPFWAYILPDTNDWNGAAADTAEGTNLLWINTPGSWTPAGSQSWVTNMTAETHRFRPRGFAISSFPHNELGKDFRFNIRTLHNMGAGLMQTSLMTQIPTATAGVQHLNAIHPSRMVWSYYFYAVDIIEVFFPEYVSRVHHCVHSDHGNCFADNNNLPLDNNIIIDGVTMKHKTLNTALNQGESAAYIQNPMHNNHQLGRDFKSGDVPNGYVSNPAGPANSDPVTGNYMGNARLLNVSDLTTTLDTAAATTAGNTATLSDTIGLIDPTLVGHSAAQEGICADGTAGFVARTIFTADDIDTMLTPNSGAIDRVGAEQNKPIKPCASWCWNGSDAYTGSTTNRVCGRILQITGLLQTYDELHLRQFGTIQEIWVQLMYAYVETLNDPDVEDDGVGQSVTYDGTTYTEFNPTASLAGVESPFPNVFFSAPEVIAVRGKCDTDNLKCRGYRTDVMQPYAGDRTASARVYSNNDSRRTYTDPAAGYQDLHSDSLWPHNSYWHTGRGDNNDPQPAVSDVLGAQTEE